MKRKQKQFLILTIILLVMVAGIFGAKKLAEWEAAAGEESTGFALVDVTADEITAFSYDYDGVTYAFTKDGDIWRYTEDSEMQLISTKMEAMVEKLAPLMAVQEIGTAADLEAYGLASPQREITFETAEASYTVEVGSYNEMSSVYYIRLAGQDRVYAVESRTINNFNYSIESLEDTSAQETTETEETSETAEETSGIEETLETEETSGTEETLGTEELSGTEEALETEETSETEGITETKNQEKN